MSDLKPSPFCCGERTEIDRRLMPPGMEWPRFEDGMKITWDDAPEDITAVCLALDGSCYSLHYDMPDDERICIYEVSERVKRPVTEVLGADGLPINVGDTVYFVSGSEPYRVDRLPERKDCMLRLYGLESQRVKLYCYYPDQHPDKLTHTQPDTQERIDEDTWKDATAYCQEYGVPVEYPKHAGKMKCEHLLGRQRELDAKTMGGAE